MLLVGSLVIAMVGISYRNTMSSLDSIVSRSLDMALEERSALPDSDADGEALGMEHLPVLWIDLSSTGAKLGSNETRLYFDTDHLTEAIGSAISSTRTRAASRSFTSPGGVLARHMDGGSP